MCDMIQLNDFQYQTVQTPSSSDFEALLCRKSIVWVYKRLKGPHVGISHGPCS